SFFIFIGVLKSKGTPIEVTRRMCHELAKRVEDPETLSGSVDIEAMLKKAYILTPDNPYDVAVDLIDKGLFQVTGYKSSLHYVILEENPYIASRGLHDESAIKTLLLRYQKPQQNEKGKITQLNPMMHLTKIIGDENRVDLLGFKPNAGEVFTLHDEPGSKRFLNTYRPILIQSAPNDLNEDIWREFEILVERLFGDKDSDEYTMGMDFVSWIIQTPEIKPAIAPFIMSVNRGVGKSLFFNVLIAIMGTAKNGERQARLVKLDEITGRFFDPSGCIINLIDEVQFPVHRDTRRESTTFWRHLKNLITAETVSVEIKGGATYQIPNSAAVALAGNFGSYFPIEEFDRRLWIIDANPVQLELGTVDHLFDLVRRSALDPDDRNRYVSTLRYKLRHHKIVNDLSVMRAPMTATKQEMYENSLTDLEEWFVTHFRDPGNVFAFTPIISSSAMYYVYEQSGRNMNDNQTFFRDLKRKGYIRPIKMKANVSTSRQFTVNIIGLDGSILRSDKREVLYTTRDHGQFDDIESEKITDMFRQNCATIGRYKQQMNSRVMKVSEEMLMK
ncbi:MAG: primase-helicase family protein, partial [Candidatus Omnitrophota bacterium]